MAGYSGTPLVKKLGIKSGMRMHTMEAPKNYAQLLGDLPEDVQQLKTLKGNADFVHIFSKRMDELAEKFIRAKALLEKDGMIWISWPKKSSKVETDITEDRIRELVLKGGMVDVKVCAIDEIWSGLKIVYRLKDR